MSLDDPLSISDFDAFVFDPSFLSNRLAMSNYARRQNEVSDLVIKKGGVIICLLRQPTAIGYADSRGRGADTFGILDQAAPNVLAFIRDVVRPGRGSHVEVLRNAMGGSSAYYRILDGVLRFAAYLDTEGPNLEAIDGTIFAQDSVSHPVGVEFNIGSGRICFVPVPEGVTGERVGSALVRIIEAHFGGPHEIETPAWATEIGVPGAGLNDSIILDLRGRRDQIDSEIGQLEDKRAQILNYRALLYGTGKSILEPVVRSAFRLFGFEVPEPEEYTGEWDVELRVPRSPFTAIGEVEGSDGVIDVDKYRQLLDYIQTEALEGHDHKGILIGNGFRLAAPDATERQNQFSMHALRGAMKNAYCLLPTTELFKAVCAILENPQDEGLKIEICDSILSTIGVWAFARGSVTGESGTSATSGGSAG